MNPRLLARLISLGRVAFGLFLLADPARAGRGWIGAASDSPGGKVALRSLGVRDALLGGLTLHVIDNEQAGPRWVAACAVADFADAAATAAGSSSLPRRGIPVIVLAAGWGAIGIAVSRALKG